MSGKNSFEGATKNHTRPRVDLGCSESANCLNTTGRIAGGPLATVFGKIRNRVLPALLAGLLALPTLPATAGESPKDGELAFPDYAEWPAFLKSVQKPNMVRDLFVSPEGAKTKKGEAFPEGTTLVMEIYNAKKDKDGNVLKNPHGKVVKDNLAKIYVMQKGKGWGQHAPKDLKNGDWIFSAFSAEGKPIEADYAKCRGCHLPLGEAKDFTHRYDEYFDKRGH